MIPGCDSAARATHANPVNPRATRIMIHNRPEFTQPRVKTHWELGVSAARPVALGRSAARRTAAPGSARERALSLLRKITRRIPGRGRRRERNWSRLDARCRPWRANGPERVGNTVTTVRPGCDPANGRPSPVLLAPSRLRSPLRRRAERQGPRAREREASGEGSASGETNGARAAPRRGIFPRPSAVGYTLFRGYTFRESRRKPSDRQRAAHREPVLEDRERSRRRTR